jgi:hypothetical protein
MAIVHVDLDREPGTTQLMLVSACWLSRAIMAGWQGRDGGEIWIGLVVSIKTIFIPWGSTVLMGTGAADDAIDPARTRPPR